MKTISVLTPCFNEESNVEEVYRRVRDVIAGLGTYAYEHVFIDNGSTDRTVEVLKNIASRDTNLKIIENARNFGPVRSQVYGLCQVRGDVVISVVADLQDPPEMIPEFLRLWESGFPIVLAIKATSEENKFMFLVRKMYYRIVNRLSSTETFENFTGFGLYDRKVIEIIKSFKDPYPYFRGIIAEIGLPHAKVMFDQPRRRRGVSSHNFYMLYDIAMLAITGLSKVPLRIVTFFGFVSALLSLGVGIVYFIYKLVFWRSFSVGVAPVAFGLFFLGSVQMTALGILGEYIGSIHTFVQNRPLVIEKGRVNFEFPAQIPEATRSSAGVS